MSVRPSLHRGALALTLAMALPAFAQAATIRIATYNIEADIDGATAPRTGMASVLQGIGEETNASGHAQPLDILALEETTSNSVTVAPIVSDLNNLYGTTRYQASPYQATEDGSNADGNGPNALVYNSASLNMLASVGVGTPQGSSNGEYRQVVRYEFQPVGGATGDVFYVYVSHYKSGTTSSDKTARQKEAQLIRDDERNLPSNASAIYVGDYNLTSSSETAYTTITGSGQGQAFDPLNSPGSWDKNTKFKGILTESATALDYRDDFQLVTSNVLNGGGTLSYISGSYTALGNNGSTAIGGTVSASSNTALAKLSDRQAILSALTTASDHLPVVADYTAQ